MAKYASVIIDITAQQLDRPFTYRIPETLQGSIRPGSVVTVPFGNGDKRRSGFCVALADKAELPDERLKEIESVGAPGNDDDGQRAIALAAWMKERYGATLSSALKVVVTTRKQAAPVKERSVELLLDRQEAMDRLVFYQKKHQVARARLLKALIEVPQQPYSLLTDKLHVNAQTMRAMKEQGVLSIVTDEHLRNPVMVRTQARPGSADQEGTEPLMLKLSDEQREIVRSVVQDFETYNRRRALDRGTLSNENISADMPPVALLHGITGSGKTEVYIRIIEEVVARGRQAIMLIPEISLTYQTLLRFYRHFGNRVSVMNSTLSESEKSDQFERARRGEIDVIIGPRSALFTPFAKIGAIVIDEEHEASYKNESMPKYHARDVAIQIARMHGAVVVLGSATPSVETYYRAQTGEYRLFTLNRRLTGGTLPQVSITDMREELKCGNRSMLSRKLAGLLEDRLAKGEQTMLFLNRRGFSGFVSCRNCGYVCKCPHCDVSLSLHKNGKLVCHYCGYEEPRPKVCPECGSKYISGFKAGTEQIEEWLQKQYPAARILRMDADTTAKKGDYEKILSAFANEEADILLGTQMIVKGHDFPKVTLVGILLADMSLYANDYRAAERTFQLLTQAAGRAGRGDLPGEVVIQTYEPEHYAVVHASRQDYLGFYEEELGYRKLLLYPPIFHMLAVQVTSKSDDHAQLYAGRIRELLDRITAGLRQHHKILIIGPASASVSRIRDDYRYVVYMKCEKYDTLIDCKDRVERLTAAMQAGQRGAAVNVQFDFDPLNPW